jgi:hypothetical protein
MSEIITKEIQVEDKFGKIGNVIITIDDKGIEFSKKGSPKCKFFVEWNRMEKAFTMDPEMPARFSSNMFGWLIEK